MTLRGPCAGPPDQKPDPEDREAQDVQQEDEQNPPGFPEELQILLPELVSRQVAHDQEADEQERRGGGGEQKQEHRPRQSMTGFRVQTRPHVGGQSR